jgi:16S rRNA (guanine527-N7)-methyltransferase
MLEDGIAQINSKSPNLNLSADQIEQLLSYGELILKWNKVYNLTAIRSEHEVITHHLLDSLAIVPLLDDALGNQVNQRVLDVGSGAGLPGLVIAICRPNWTVHTLDTVQKKATFMQQACGSLKLHNAQSIHQRVEQYSPNQPYGLICSRAFSSIENFIAWSNHLLSEDGVFAALKGKLEVDKNIPDGWELQQLIEVNVPFLPGERHLFLIKR